MSIDPIIQQLPKAYRSDIEQAEIAEALTSAINTFLTNINEFLDNYESLFLDPYTCQPEWYDIIAEWTGWGELWSSTWPDEAKRCLLINTNKIWSNRGNIIGFTTVINCFRLQAELRQATGWILAETAFTGTEPLLLVDPFAYIIRVPSNYTEGTVEYNLVQYTIDNFLPCWGEYTIQISGTSIT
ncbi:MAG: hypothetical protein F6J98_01695 [Moorea sp. SIO4G2]|nr:hypothetical protein [Moorena sp. SIO4G2]